MRRLVTAFIFIALPLAARRSSGRPGLPKRPAAVASGLDLASLDHTRRPLQTTSTSSPAAAGSRTIRSRRTVALGPLRRAPRAQQRRSCTRSSTRGRRHDAGHAEDRRLLRQLHGRTRHREKGATPLDADLKRIAALCQTRAGLPRLARHAPPMGVNAFFSFGAEPDFKDATMTIATSIRAASACPIATTTSATTPSRSICASSTSSTSRTCWRLPERRARTPRGAADDRRCGSKPRSPRPRSTPWRGATR